MLNQALKGYSNLTHRAKARQATNGSNLASGVHTGSEKNAESANGRNVFYSGRKQENSSFLIANNETGNPKYTDNWDDEKSGQKKHASAGRKNSGNASERDANE